MNTVAFTIDEKECKLKVMFDKNKSIDYTEYVFSPDLISGNHIDYEKIFSQALSLFVEQEDIYPASAIYVMPDKYAFYDYVETPTLSGKRLNDMLDLELSTRFKQRDLYKTVFAPMGSQGGKSAFIAFMVRNGQINSISNALKPYKFVSRSVTFEAVMMTNAFLHIKPLGKRNSVLFADIKDSETKLAVVKDSRLIAFSSIPYGKDLCELGSKLKSAPAVLPTGQYYDNNQTAFDCGDGSPKSNVKYLLRTITEMRDVVANKYHVGDLNTIYNVAETCAMLFAGQKGMERINTKSHIIAKNLELYGAIVPKIYDKGLLF